MPFPLFVCPIHHLPLAEPTAERRICPACATPYPQVAGVWHFLPPARQAHYRQFVQEYETIRHAEGRGRAEADWYRQLPHTAATDPHAAMWAQRAASYHLLGQHVLRTAPNPLQIVDMGAGNGWLANQLAGLGHGVAAVDLTLNEFDGLGAHKQYATQFCSVWAEFDQLPWAAEQVDLLIFNASFHYSTDYEATLREAWRVLAPHGRVVIMDTPVYHNPASGQRMAAERAQAFTARYGFPSTALPNQNFLTYAQLAALTAAFSAQLTIHHPVPPLRRAVRWFKTTLRRQREPGQFPLLVMGKKEKREEIRGLGD